MTYFKVGTTLMTPSGTPARCASYQRACKISIERQTNFFLTSASAKEEYGVSGGGLMTAVHPAASAAPSFRAIIAEGKFHGVRIDLVLYQNFMAHVLERQYVHDTY